MYKIIMLMTIYYYKIKYENKEKNVYFQMLMFRPCIEDTL